MHISHHARQRMCQRGISRRLLDFALRYGRVEGDKYVVDRNESRRIIEELSEDLRLARQVMDKGGITVVEESATVITAYNPSVPMRHGKAPQPFIPHQKAPAPLAFAPAARPTPAAGPVRATSVACAVGFECGAGQASGRFIEGVRHG
jgi:hypothetical protein